MANIFNDLKKNKEQAEQGKKEEVDSKVNGDGSSNFTLTSKKETQKLKRTYYLEPEQDKNIAWAARRTGRDKSEIVRLALDYFFAHVEIE